MIDITQIPTEEFPLNHERYNRLMDELRDAARGFERLGTMGWPGGKDLDRRLMTIRSDLLSVWETIQETEFRMRAAEAAGAMSRSLSSLSELTQKLHERVRAEANRQEAEKAARLEGHGDSTKSDG